MAKETSKRKVSSSRQNNDSSAINSNVSAPSGTRNEDTSESNEARATKKARGLENDWGLLEVLIECGVSSVSLSSGGVTNNNDESEREGKKKGCILLPGVSSASLHASIHTLLKEMHQSGVDVDNCRVIEMMEEFIASGKLTSKDNGSDQNKETIISDASASGQIAAPAEHYKHTLLHKILLPMHHESDDVDVAIQGSKSSVVTGGATSVTLPKRNRSSNTSLMKILLCIDTLQPALLSSLFQKLAELASSQDQHDDDDDEQDTMNVSVEKILDRQAVDEELPRLIISHIRWIDHITEPSTLAAAALECLSVLSTTSCEGMQKRRYGPSTPMYVLH